MADLSLHAKTSVDLSGWNTGMTQMFADAKTWQDKAGRLALSPPASSGSGASSASGAGTGLANVNELASAIQPLGDRIASSLKTGLQPLNAFIPRFGAQFEVVGQVIINMARRMDSQMRFPIFQRSIETVREKVVRTFTDAEGRVGKFARGADLALATVGNVSKIRFFFTSLTKLTSKGRTDLNSLNTVNFNSTIKNITNINKATQNVGASVKQLTVSFAAAFGFVAITSKVADFFKTGISGAMNLQETVSKVGEVFGSNAGKIEKNAQDMADKFGLPKQELLDSAAAFGLIGKAAGFNGDKTTALSKDMSNLAADVSSFYNIPLDEALNKLRSGLVGEAEPMRALGVLLNEDAIKAEAFRMGLVKGGQALTEQAKVQARASLITKGLADAQGDLARTQNSTSNQFRKFTGSVQNMAVSFGQMLLPTIDKVLAVLNGMGSKMMSVFEGAKPLLLSVVGVVEELGTVFYDVFVAGFTSSESTISSWGQTLTNWFNEASVLIRNWRDVYGIAVTQITENIANLGIKFSTFGKNVVVVGKWIADNWADLFRTAFDYIGTLVGNLAKNAMSIAKAIWDYIKNPAGGMNIEWTSLTDGFESSIKELPKLLEPQLVDMSAEIAKHTDNIIKREGDRADKKRAEEEAKKNEKPVKRGVLQTNTGETATQAMAKKVTSWATSFKEGTKTAVEKFNESMDFAKKALASGEITKEQFDKHAENFAMKEAGFSQQKSFSGALELGSKDAYSAILAATTGKVSGFQNLEKTGKDQLTELKNIAGGIAKIVSGGPVSMLGLGAI